MSSLAIVVIGRNEGERLKRCLRSLKGFPCVYVDSGSSDGSPEAAQALGASVVELDLGVPFTAARARNEGFFKVTADSPGLQYVMFVDGDCEVVDGWIEKAIAYLDAHNDVVAVCGRRKERFPEASIYNAMCDIEWNTPVGEAASCGGDAIFRVSAMVEASGFNSTFIAGEEPELCFRLRKNGGRIYRLDSLMTMHDAAMTRFGQWWRRSERSGYAYYLGYHAHGIDSFEPFKVREVKSIVSWGSLILLLLLTSLLVPVVAIFGGLLLFVQSCRVARTIRVRAKSMRESFLYGFFTMLGKIPQLIGISKAYLKCKSGETLTIVEYK